MKYPGNSLMKRGKIWSVAGSVALVMASLPSFGADLLSVYDQALENDPQIAEADANRRANRQAPQAWANLLPGLSASAGRTKQWNDGSGSSEFLQEEPPGSGIYVKKVQPNNGSTVGTTDQWSLQLRQTLFSVPDYMAVITANRQVAQAEIEFVSAQQELVQRVARQYFAVLQAQDTLRAQEAARDAVARQLEQAERRFEVGLIAITDVQETRAARDNANANVIGAKRSLSSAEEQLRAIIGNKPASLNEPTADMPLLTPNPASEEEWVKTALEQNAALVSSRLSADIARDTVKSTFGSLVPEVALTAGKNYSDSDSSRDALGQSLDTNSKNRGKSIGLQFSLNLNGLGTGNYSRGKQSQYRWIAAKERLERVSRDTERQARDAYLGVNSEIARVQALRQAVESSRTALAAAEAGYDVGTRTSVDVLNQRQALAAAETNYSAAKYSYLNNLISLRLAAGDLDREAIEEINRWLGPPAPPPVTPAPAAQ
jgi:outer membrane protein